jgi:hypothetical protein
MVDDAKISKEGAHSLKEELYRTGERDWSELKEIFSG